MGFGVGSNSAVMAGTVCGKRTGRYEHGQIHAKYYTRYLWPDSGVPYSFIEHG